ncbi:GNAT family N-acetyltransferase [Halobacillus yeomjeoni]|uniref:GNAT family N-acetyltransferase n=1 Tax=Halobacillus yeomjeoni TaxID=311194 RepID=A0A931MUB9_9BACI|nr:GNAT family protein [Halobacillus yeomjeoni]MBH0229094.1 GNAT family N-acetyltransferase [Halobacillus yeomjeoni]
MEITIHQLKGEDAEAVFKFENDNRTFFEKMVPSRGEEYYNFDTFMVRHQTLLEEQSQGLSAFYLIRKSNNELLGRINLIDIDKSKISGYVGYRVGENHTGKGIACKALHMLMEDLKEEGFTKLSAKTTNNNFASQKVLERNGFKKLEENNEEFVMNGETLRFVHYVWVI